MKKFLSATLVISLLLSMMVLFTACGEPATLEEYMNKDGEVQQSIESMGESSNMDISVEGNTITYTYKYAQTYDSSVIPSMAKTMESTMNNMSSTFEKVAENLEEQTEIDDITVRVVYLNGDGTEIYSQNFTSR